MLRIKTLRFYGYCPYYLCVSCGRQFIDTYESHKGYDPAVKKDCLKMDVNGLGFRAIERVSGVHNTTIMAWVKKVGEILPDYYNPEQIPESAVSWMS
jgi:transposase-like protein